jgi:hypothetical protein
VRPNNPVNRGMVNSVSHLVKVEELDGDAHQPTASNSRPAHGPDERETPCH